MANRKLVVELLGDSHSLERAFTRSSRGAANWNRDMSRASRGALVATVGFRGLGRSIAFASGAFIGAAGITAGLKASIEGFSSFTEAMQKAVGLAGVGQDRIAGFSKQILELGPKVGKSPQELANAFFFVASSGIAASKAMDVVSASAKASAAGLGETQVVADAVTSAMNAYGPSVLSAQKATDVLVATVREGKGEASQFAGVIGNVAAIASQLGVSFNEVGAALAAETRLGTDAETAATQLQRVLTSLVKITPAQAKAFKSVGLNADVLREQLGTKGLLFVLKEVKKAFAGNTPALAKAFGDIRALRGVLALVGNQSAATEGIFKRLRDTTGSLSTAFDAVSKTTAQRFRQLQASAQVLGISIGAIIAPLAGEVAQALTKVADELTGFFDRLGAAKTIRGKLNVVWEGVTDATKGAESALERAVRAVDWNQVWSSARGIADGLQKQLETIDFNFVGKRIGEGIADAVKFAIPAAKDIGTRITAAIRTIDFVAVGRAMGPGLAAAIVEAFVTLTDPTFWAKNWDLALAVAITVFSGSLGRVLGKLAAPLAKFGSGVVERIGFAIIDRVPRLSQAVFDAFAKLVPLAGRALAPLVAAVSRIFGRLGNVTRFVIKVLGLQAAIDAVVGFARRVEGLFVELKNFVEKQAILTALAFLKPLDFTVLGHHLIPGLHGLVKSLEKELDDLANHAERSAKRVNAAIGAIGPNTLTDRGTSRGRADAGATKRQVQQDAAAASSIATQSVASSDRITKASKTTETAMQKAQKAFAKLMDALSLRLEKAGVSARLSDDIVAQKKINAAIEDEIKIEGRTTDLARQLFQGRQALADIQRRQKAGKQFQALGLTATGETKVPSVAALSKRLGSLRGQVKGTFLDTAKTRSELQRIARVLSGQFGKVGSDVRQAILGMLNDITNALKGGSGKLGPLTKTTGLNTRKIVEGLGLSPEQIREIRSRLSGFNTAGRALAVGGGNVNIPVVRDRGFEPITVESHVTVELDGQKVGAAVTRSQQRTRRRNPRQKRGPHRR